MKILVIIPAYNESENIEKVVDNLIENYPQYDYLVVNDCSTDDTEDILKRRGYNYISLPVNLGIGGGVQSGYIYAAQNDYDIAIQIDGDGQHDPAYIGKLIRPIIDGEADITVGSRFIEKEGFQTSFLRRLGINIIRLVIKICCGVNATDTTSGFRASNREATKFFASNYAQDYPEPEAIVSASLNNFRFKDVPVVMKEREGGVSSINAKRSIYYMIKVSLAIIICRIGTRRKKK
ncbi:MAG: glycosyltransferase family 2 protein [Oscillospiraceae bacterium]|nr:glycosyltransferase family 2 protein [Oscillospiraceae bacterium]